MENGLVEVDLMPAAVGEDFSKLETKESFGGMELKSLVWSQQSREEGVIN